MSLRMPRSAAKERDSRKARRELELAPRLLAGRAAAKVLQRRARRSPRQVGLVLMHHEIAPAQGSRDRDIVPALGTDLFRAQLEHLGRHYEVVPLGEMVSRVRSRSPGERLPVALTFDDDLSRHASVAAPILAEFGCPATFFLSGNCLQGAAPFWWQDLQAIMDRGPQAWSDMQAELAPDWPWARLDRRFGELAATIEALPPEQRDAVAERLREITGPAPVEEGLSGELIKDLVRRGFEVGFHTLRHYALPTLATNRLDEAMREGLDELEGIVGYRPTAIAYPHTRADLRVAEAADRAGFQLGLICSGGPVTPEQNPLLLDRIDGWANSLAGFSWALARCALAT
jgi:peptidoglycan/xylan/chitin deacetylase (PgdA/CDA1 family)